LSDVFLRLPTNQIKIDFVCETVFFQRACVVEVWLIFIVVPLLPILVRSQTLPPEGAYICVRWDLMRQLGEGVRLKDNSFTHSLFTYSHYFCFSFSVFSLQLADSVNTYTQTPSQSGETNEVTYVLSNFLYDVDLEDFFYSTSGSPLISSGWKSFRFVIQFDYHVCAKIWPHPCESGWVIVYTTTEEGSTLLIFS
jgi:hypothetical protein